MGCFCDCGNVRNANVHGIADTLCDNQKGRGHFAFLIKKRLQCADGKFRADMTGPQIDNAVKRLSICYCQRPEIAVLRENDALLCMSALQQVGVVGTGQPFFLHG